MGPHCGTEVTELSWVISLRKVLEMGGFCQYRFCFDCSHIETNHLVEKRLRKRGNVRSYKGDDAHRRDTVTFMTLDDTTSERYRKTAGLFQRREGVSLHIYGRFVYLESFIHLTFQIAA